MQDRFFRVDGADLETGEETYLVLQAVSVEEAETVARTQGMVVAAVRAASQSDWGAGARPTLATGEPDERSEKRVIKFEPADHRTFDDSAALPALEPTPAPPTAKQSVFAEAPVSADPRPAFTSPKPPAAIPMEQNPESPAPRNRANSIQPDTSATASGRENKPAPAAVSAHAKPVVSAPVRKPPAGQVEKVEPPRAVTAHSGNSGKPAAPALKSATLASTPAPPRPGGAPAKPSTSIHRIAPPPAPAKQVRLTPAVPPRRIPPAIPAAAIAPPPAAPAMPPPPSAQAHQARIVDMAPAVAESQRMSGEVVGGSGFEHVAADIDWEQGAEAVEHSAGSALEQLSWGSTASFPAQGDATVESATELTAPTAEIPVARVVALPSSAANAPISTPKPQSRAIGMSPLVAYVLSPIATLLTLGGLILAIISLLSPVPADVSDVTRLEFRLDDITHLFLGSMLFMAGLLIYVVAALAQVMRVVKARR